MLDLLLRNCTLADGRTGIDIGMEGGRIVAVQPAKEMSEKSGEQMPAFTRTREPTTSFAAPPFMSPRLFLIVTRIRDPRPVRSSRNAGGI